MIARIVTIIGFSVLAASGASGLGVTEAACLSSPNSPGQQVCACAQGVADLTLAHEDQVLAALIIADPDQWLTFKYGQDTHKHSFLERYSIWGETAAVACQR